MKIVHANSLYFDPNQVDASNEVAEKRNSKKNGLKTGILKKISYLCKDNHYSLKTKFMKPNKYINASYQLYDVTDGQRELLEETTEAQPFSFISGLGILLDAFERQVVDLEAGREFDFVLTPAQAYGEYVDENVFDMDKEMFSVDGSFDEQNVYQDAVIPMQDENGKRFTARVLSVTDSKVTIDLNHPLAGKTLNFTGKINENRDATNEELSRFVEDLTGQGGGCGCGGNCQCGDGDGEGSCGCGNHEDGECCGGGHKDGQCCGGGHGSGDRCNCKN